MTEAWPTEAAATAAVEAAAKKAYERDVEERRKVFPPSIVYTDWDDLAPISQHSVKEVMLPLVWAALEALPDPRHATWAEGYAAGYSDGGFDSAGSGAYEYAENPYPMPPLPGSAPSQPN